MVLNILHEISERKANCIGHILRRNCLLQRVIDGKIKGGIEVRRRRGRRRRKLLHDLKERRGYSHLKEEALDRTMWRDGFGRGFGPAIRQTTKWMNDSSAFVENFANFSWFSLVIHVGKSSDSSSSSIEISLRLNRENHAEFCCVPVGTVIERSFEYLMGFWCSFPKYEEWFNGNTVFIQISHQNTAQNLTREKN